MFRDCWRSAAQDAQIAFDQVDGCRIDIRTFVDHNQQPRITVPSGGRRSGVL